MQDIGKIYKFVVYVTRKETKRQHMLKGNKIGNGHENEGLFLQKEYQSLGKRKGILKEKDRCVAYN